jgi:hypothetical protein
VLPRRGNACDSIRRAEADQALGRIATGVLQAFGVCGAAAAALR